MPIYDYACADCGQLIEVRATVTERAKGLHLRCPKCGSKKIARVFSPQNILSTASAVPSGGSCCCAGGKCR